MPAFELKNVIFLLIFLISFGIFFFSCNNLIKYLKVARKKDDRNQNFIRRIKRVWTIAFAQTKLLRDPTAGILHLLIFWGFVIFIIAVIEAIIQGFYSPFNLRFLGPVNLIITAVHEVFAVLVILAVLFALYRRYILKIARLEVGTSGKIDATVILVMIMFVCITMLGQSASSIAGNNFLIHENEIRPVSASISSLLFTDGASADFYYELFWWAHVLIVFIFLNYLPYSKHLHVLSSIPNVFFANLEPERNTLKKLDLEDENSEQFGASDIEHLSWKQLLDGYSCTECGRCTDACPANAVGKTLSPRKIIVDIRARTKEKAPLLSNGITDTEVIENTLVHNFISDKELWQCTTCMACVQECPVMIEHVDSIVDMRRYLVLTESQFPSNLNNVFKSLENNFTPWAFNQSDRANWAEGLNIKTMAEDKNTEYLFWVGCAGSFDDRYKKVSRAFAQLMQKAGIDFRILGTEEKCNGDTARRLGNEYLAQMMMMENAETLNNYGVKKIVTACPHCYHSLKNEYKQFGGNFDVTHHTELISELLDEGRITLNDSSDVNKITYHDSCYLGRYNGIYDSPRKSLAKLSSVELVEMNRSKSKGFCCGAGGGRMFLEDEEGGRINEERTREALETNASTVASACPFCMTMMTDGVKHFEKSDQVLVKDIAEIILENSN